jgi:hypothetical protein
MPEMELGTPQGQLFADPAQELNIPEEEITRAGVQVTRSYRYARWIDGSTHVWIGRRKRPGRGEGSSGLRYDVIEPSG